MTTANITVAQYLLQLKLALVGAPPGLIADALADCEEHLRGEIAAHPGKSEAEVLAEAIDSYGTPEEVAAGYRDSEAAAKGPFPRPDVAIDQPGRPVPWRGGLFGVIRDPVTYGALLYMLVSPMTGIFYFFWIVTGLSMSFGLLVLIIGIPFFLLFMGSVRLLAHMEGRIVEGLLGVRMPRRLPSARPGTLFEQVKNALMDRRTWSSIAYMLLMLPLGVTYFSSAITMLGVSLGLIGGGTWIVFGGHHVQIDGSTDWNHGALLGAIVLIGGLVTFVASLHLTRALGALHSRIAESLLVRL